MREYILNTCYNQDVTIKEKPCEHVKIFFDVIVDFENVRLIICKSWYDSVLKMILSGLNTKATDWYFNKYKTNYSKHSSFKYITLNDARCIILEYIIEHKFTHYVGNIVFKDDTKYIRYSQYPIYHHICEDPFMIKDIDMFKFIEYYKFEYDRDLFPEKSYNLWRLFEECICNLKKIAKDELSKNKYIKMRRLFDKMDWTNNDFTIEALTEFLYELSKSTNINLKNKL